MILGIDEAGRGPWAGPLVVGAVVLGGVQIEGLTDSKKLSKKKREILEVEVLEKAKGYGLGWVSARELDEIGMSEALRCATVRAVNQVTCKYSEIIIDGTVNFLQHTGKGRYVKTMPKADLLVPSVSAASILAKVGRDRYMSELGDDYAYYGFSSNAGYGVAKHREAIERHGVSPEHRLSFAPLQKYRPKAKSVAPQTNRSDMRQTTKSIGDKAESIVVNHLEHKGHEVVARNWRTKYCEIDIVSCRDKTLYFTEVKYRHSSTWGDGMSAVTYQKQQQMRFAAEVFMSYFKQCAHYEQRLAVASVTGDEYQIEDWILL